MPIFKAVKKEENLQKSIHAIFDMDLSIDGDWGYSEEKATIIHAGNKMPKKQLQHMLITMRSHLEMNITEVADNRYGAINANESAREVIENNTKTFDKVTYKITAMKEDLYNAFIKEYKAGYENGLDLSEHFKRREEATLVREVVYYFDVTSLS